MYCSVQPESANIFLHFSLYFWISFTNMILGNLTIFINQFFYFIVINFILRDDVFISHVSLIIHTSSVRLPDTCSKLKCDVDWSMSVHEAAVHVSCCLTIVKQHVLRLCIPNSAEVCIFADMSLRFARVVLTWANKAQRHCIWSKSMYLYRQ